MSTRYTAFISYSHADSAMVEKLHQALERFTIPTEVVGQLALERNHLRPVFRDRDELSAATSLSSSLEEALAASNHLIVTCSPSAAASAWVAEEISTFVQLHGRSRVLAVIVAGEDNDNVLPEPLRYELDPSGGVDRTKPLTPLAADARASADGFDAAVLKLVAGVIGARYDDLARREQQRRTKRLRRIALASVAGMIGALTLAGYALFQRSEAMAAQAIAEQRNATANRVIEFLTDTFRVADPLTENPREVTALTILERGAERLGDELTEEPVVRARLMAVLGDVYGNLGLFEPAENLFESSLSLDSGDDEFRAERLIALAETKLRQAQLDKVPDLLLDAETALADAPAPLLRARLSTARGMHALPRFELAVAESQFESAIDRYTEEVGETDVRTARAQARLANLYTESGRFDEALELVDKAIEAYDKEVGTRHSTSAGLRVNRANIQVQRLDYDAAQADIGDAIETLHDILGDSHPTLATAYFNRGLALLRQGSVESIDAFATAREMGQTHYGTTHGFLVSVLFNAAVAHARYGELDVGLEMIDETARIVNELYPADHVQTAFVLTQRGVVYGEAGDNARARSYCERGVTRLDALSNAQDFHKAMARDECGRWLTP